MHLRDNMEAVEEVDHRACEGGHGGSRGDMIWRQPRRLTIGHVREAVEAADHKISACFRKRTAGNVKEEHGIGV